MPDREIAGRHPFHPALVHFPIACWGLSHPADLAALLGTQVVFFGLDWWPLSCLLTWAGVVSAVPAMVVGIYDFMQLPDENRLMRVFYKHAGFVGMAWILYLASGYTRLADNPVPAPPVLLPALISGAGLICLCIGGWYGGQLVYKYHLGSNPGA
jgi:uncharacterized membrane protein